MPLEIDKMSSKVMPIQEIILSRLDLDLNVGDTFRAVVIAMEKHQDITLNINGKNLTAKTQNSFAPGDVLALKVLSNDNQIVLKVEQKAPSAADSQKILLQSTLLQVLPQQASAADLFDSLYQLLRLKNLPSTVEQRIQMLLYSIVPLGQLPQYFMNALQQSGAFLEANVLYWQPGMNDLRLKADLKGLYLKLLSSLSVTDKNAMGLSITSPGPNLPLKYDSIPLPGAVPQPEQNNAFLNLLHQSSDTIQNVLYHQVSQALARITAQQINYLSQDQSKGFVMMLDLPIRTDAGIDVVPLLLEEHKAALPVESMWSITFALNLPELGKLQATVSLYGKTQINLAMNTEHMHAKETLEAAQEDIELLFKELDLTLKQFNVVLGLKANHIDNKNICLLDLRI